MNLTQSAGSLHVKRLEDQVGSWDFGSSVPVRAYAGGCAKEGPIMSNPLVKKDLVDAIL